MKNKTKITLTTIGIILSTVLLIISSEIAENKVINELSATLLTSVSVVLFFVAVFFAVKVDYETGVYECRECGHTFKPTFNAYLWASHTPTTRHLRCPKCEEKSWCKRRATTE